MSKQPIDSDALAEIVTHIEQRTERIELRLSGTNSDRGLVQRIHIIERWIAARVWLEKIILAAFLVACVGGILSFIVEAIRRGD